MKLVLDAEALVVQLRDGVRGLLAVRDIVRRYGAESTLGNFGVYFGNQEKGRVHATGARG